MHLSIVTTLYHSAPYLPEFYERIRREVERISCDHEIILVNDGSPDNSLDVALTLYAGDPHVRILDLSRNFGHHKAMMTGLSHARGDLVFLIDCDLEEPPEMLGRFYEAFNNGDADVVYGVQEARKGAWFERVSGRLFYSVVNALSDQKIPVDVLVVRLMSRRYVANLVRHQESELSMSSLWQATGFKQVPLLVHKRGKPSTTYNLRRKLSVLVRAVTSFSNKPLFYIAYLGGGILALSVIYILYLLVAAVIGGHAPSAFAVVFASVWLSSGLVILSLGVVAIYLSIIFVETKHRPYTIIRRIYDRDES